MYRLCLLFLGALVVSCDATAPSQLVRLTLPRCVVLDGAFGFFAFRNEGGEWTPLARSLPDSVFTFDATPRVEIAWGGTNTFILRTTVEELQAVTCPAAFTPPTGPEYTVSVVGLKSDDLLRFQAARTTRTLPAGQASQFTIRPERSPFDAVAIAEGPYGSTAPRRTIIRHGLAPSGAALQVFDFAGPEALPMESMEVSVSAAPVPEVRNVSARFLTAAGTAPSLRLLSSATLPTLTVERIPDAQTAVGDLYEIEVSAFPLSPPTYVKTAKGWFTQGATKSLELGPTVNNPAVTPRTFSVSSGIPDRVTYDATTSVDPAYPGLAVALFAWDHVSFHTYMMAMTTSGFRGDATEWELSVPNLSALGASHLTAGTGSRLWRLTVYSSGLDTYFGRIPGAGATSRSVASVGALP